MTAEEENRALKEQLREALERLAKMEAVLAENQALHEQLAAAKREIEELKKQKTPLPAFVKANVLKPAQDEKKPRKKREAKHNHGRRREAPTRIVEHAIAFCPHCRSRLGGVSEARRRQVIEIAPPPPVEVTEHVVYHGWCSQCQKWREAPLDVSEQVLGQGRLGVRIASLIGYLRTVLRVPVRQIQSYLSTLHGLRISSGEIVEISHRLSKQLEPQLTAIKAAIRASPAVQADETGWREDGINGYVWCACTPQLRLYEYHHSRGSEVVEQLLGKVFEGVLGSDFYAAYNIHQGLHQRCWVHLLRDIRDLKKQHPDDGELLSWAKAVKTLYEEACAYGSPDASEPPAKQEAARRQQQHNYEQQLWQVCAPYVRTTALMHTLCERVERFLPELFVFVAVPGVPAHNNLAERSVRPVVIARKISGGTRAPHGSQTRMALFSLFGTWTAQGRNPFLHCLALLTRQLPLGQM